jgi:hypothetical protein
MKRSLLISGIAALVAIAGWQLAYAQSSPDSTGAAGTTTPGTTTSTTTTTAPSGDATTTTTTTTNTAPTPSAAYMAARERGKASPPKDVETIDKQLLTLAKQIDEQAARAGDPAVAGRLASDFGLSSDALMAEKARYNAGWGDLMIAHTLGSNTLTGVTVDEIFVMHSTDAMGWGQIANGLDLKLGSVVSAMKSQGKVATGAARADGKPAKIATAQAATTGSNDSKSSPGTGSSGMGSSGDATTGASK